jgi:small subunit ribosomal protein S2
MSVKLPEIKEMYLAGMHFGHKKERSHPKAKDFIFGVRDGINVINLDKTLEMMESVFAYITDAVNKGKTILILGTKKQIKDTVKSVAEKSMMPYINFRWLGGTFTNYDTIRKGIKNLIDMEKKINDPEIDLTKKEKSIMEKEINKMNEIFGGIRDMQGLPDVLFVVDVAKEQNAIKEARKKGVITIGICDTDANPQDVDYYIPANDDAKDSVDMILNLLAETIVSARNKSEKTDLTDKKEVAASKEVAIDTQS